MKARALSLFALFALSLGSFAAPRTSAAETAKKPPTLASVQDLAWIAGSWRGTIDGGEIEEVWTAPAGGRMLGMFRWTKGDRLIVYELLELAPNAANHAVLRLRHFGAKLNAFEDKEGALVFKLSASTPTEAQFLQRTKEQTTRLVYKKDGDRGLIVTLFRTSQGKEQRDEFRYTRQSP
jgi:Domain of unknown function (DUF6265)